MKPIIFSTKMVQALLDDRKTQTRRVIKNEIFQQWVEAGFTDEFIKNSENHWVEVSPYQPGDILWVRETWQRIDAAVGLDLELDGYAYVYRASENGEAWAREIENWKWRPSIYMPKEAARIFLQVTGIRVERVQDITGFDCVNEGIDTLDILENTPGSDFEGYARLQFSKLWDNLNAKRGYGWQTNPWVWVIEFQKQKEGAA